MLGGAAVFFISAVVSASPVSNSIWSKSDTQTRLKETDEQTEFGSDSDLRQPIVVPKAALDALRKALKVTPDALPSDDLRASQIHLSTPSETDLVVPRFVGSHAAFFYVLKPTADGYRIIFDFGGDSLTVLRSKSRGYRDLKMSSFTQAGRSQVSVIYKFDGTRYVKVSERTEIANWISDAARAGGIEPAQLD